MNTFHQENIVCPECQTVQAATVEHTWPFNSYVHVCQCGYTIIESEWELANVAESENRK